MRVMSKMLTKDAEKLPESIREAILNGYNVMIRRDVKDGVVSAKVTYFKYSSASRIPICREEELKNRKP